jgi:hypothetical protein
VGIRLLVPTLQLAVSLLPRLRRWVIEGRVDDAGKYYKQPSVERRVEEAKIDERTKLVVSREISPSLHTA